jgi:hypothetical protein
VSSILLTQQKCLPGSYPSASIFIQELFYGFDGVFDISLLASSKEESKMIEGLGFLLRENKNKRKV